MFRSAALRGKSGHTHLQEPLALSDSHQALHSQINRQKKPKLIKAKRHETAGTEGSETVTNLCTGWFDEQHWLYCLQRLASSGVQVMILVAKGQRHFFRTSACRGQREWSTGMILIIY
jgi:hypothetical protein